MSSNEATDFLSALSLDDDLDENKDLKEFYERILPILKKCSMKLIPYEILSDIAIGINDLETFHENWKIYASLMGIDNDTIAKIKAGAYCHRELEILFAMDKTIRQQSTFGYIIQALLKRDRYDILKKIEPFVRNLLLKISQNSDENCAIKINSASFNEQNCELNYFQQHSMNGHFKNAHHISDTPKLFEESLEGKKAPSAPKEEKLTVLITHAESENDIAEKLSAEFSKQDVIATTLAEVNDLTRYEPVNVLDTVFREVNFIVPVLSEGYAKEIYPGDRAKYLESVHAKNSLRLYKLMTHEYASDRCINYRVRPVIVEGMSRRPDNKESGSNKKLMIEPLFAFPFRLPKEVPKLIKVLKETKELRAQIQIEN